jgi:NAD(P)-dependent dehydrogenase (short-subunit alcohol dehydrogenase family)
MQQLIPRLKEQGYGQIINISSMAGRQGVPGLGLYSASKGAVDLLSQTAAAEVRNDGIKICCVSPGSTDTGFMPSRSSKPGLHQRAQHRLHPDQVAELVLFVAKQDERAWSFMTDIRPLIIK